MSSSSARGRRATTSRASWTSSRCRTGSRRRSTPSSTAWPEYRDGVRADAVHELISELDYPMFIVTAASGDERAGCLVGFATQCSIHPPRFLVCLSDKNRTFRVAQGADLLAVHFVPASAHGLA